MAKGSAKKKIGVIASKGKGKVSPSAAAGKADEAEKNTLCPMGSRRSTRLQKSSSKSLSPEFKESSPQTPRGTAGSRKVDDVEPTPSSSTDTVIRPDLLTLTEDCDAEGSEPVSSKIPEGLECQGSVPSASTQMQPPGQDTSNTTPSASDVVAVYDPSIMARDLTFSQEGGEAECQRIVALLNHYTSKYGHLSAEEKVKALAKDLVYSQLDYESIKNRCQEMNETQYKLIDSTMVFSKKAEDSEDWAIKEHKRAEEAWKTADAATTFTKSAQHGAFQKQFLSKEYSDALQQVQLKCEERLKVLEKDRTDLSKTNQRLTRTMKTRDAKYHRTLNVYKRFLVVFTKAIGKLCTTPQNIIKDAFISAIDELEQGVYNDDGSISLRELFSESFDVSKCKDFAEELTEKFTETLNKLSSTKKSRKRPFSKGGTQIAEMQISHEVVQRCSSSSDSDCDEFENVEEHGSGSPHTMAQNFPLPTLPAGQSKVSNQGIPLRESYTPPPLQTQTLSEMESSGVSTASSPTFQNQNISEHNTEESFKCLEAEKNQSKSMPEVFGMNPPNNEPLLLNTSPPPVLTDEKREKVKEKSPRRDPNMLVAVEEIDETLVQLAESAMKLPPNMKNLRVVKKIKQTNKSPAKPDSAPNKDSSNDIAPERGSSPPTSTSTRASSPVIIPPAVIPLPPPPPKTITPVTCSTSTAIPDAKATAEVKKILPTSPTSLPRMDTPRPEGFNKINGSQTVNTHSAGKQSGKNYPLPLRERRSQIRQTPNPVRSRLATNFQEIRPVSEGSCDKRRLEEQWKKRKQLKRKLEGDGDTVQKKKKQSEEPPLRKTGKMSIYDVLYADLSGRSDDDEDDNMEVTDKSDEQQSAESDAGVAAKPGIVFGNQQTQDVSFSNCGEVLPGGFYLKSKNETDAISNCFAKPVLPATTASTFNKESTLFSVPRKEFDKRSGQKLTENPKKTGIEVDQQQQCNLPSPATNPVQSHSQVNPKLFKVPAKTETKLKRDCGGVATAPNSLFGDEDEDTAQNDAQKGNVKDFDFSNYGDSGDNNLSSSEDEDEVGKETSNVSQSSSSSKAIAVGSFSKPGPEEIRQLSSDLQLSEDDDDVDDGDQHKNIKMNEEFNESPASPDPGPSNFNSGSVKQVEWSTISVTSSSKVNKGNPLLKECRAELKRLVKIDSVNLHTNCSRLLQMARSIGLDIMSQNLFQMMLTTTRTEAETATVVNLNISECPLIPRFANLFGIMKLLHAEGPIFRNIFSAFINVFTGQLKTRQWGKHLNSDNEWLLLQVGRLFGAIFKAYPTLLDAKRVLITCAGIIGPLFYSLLYGVLCSYSEVLGYVKNVSRWIDLDLGIQALLYSLFRCDISWSYSKKRKSLLEFLQQIIGIQQAEVPETGKAEFLRTLIKSVMGVESARELEKCEDVLAMTIVRCGGWQWWKISLKTYLEEAEDFWKSNSCSDGAFAAVIKGFAIGISWMKKQDTPDQKLNDLIGLFQKYVSEDYSPVVQQSSTNILGILYSIEIREDGKDPEDWKYERCDGKVNKNPKRKWKKQKDRKRPKTSGAEKRARTT